MPALECKELCKSYGRTMALDRLSLAIEPGRRGNAGASEHRAGPADQADV